MGREKMKINKINTFPHSTLSAGVLKKNSNHIGENHKLSIKQTYMHILLLS